MLIAVEGVREAADRLADAERTMNEEYLRLVALGTPSFQASIQAKVAFEMEVYRWQAEYEIALARLRRIA